MKLIISTVVGAIFLFLLGWLLYGMIFMEYFQVHYEYISRSAESMRAWAFGVANLLQAFFLSLIYSRFFWKGEAPAKEGFICGLFLGLLYAVPFVFYAYGGLRISSWQAPVVDGILMFVMMVLTAIVIAFTYGKKEKPAS